MILLIPICTNISNAENQKQNLNIYTVNYPLQYFAERIGDDKVNVYFPVPSDVDPAFWSPKREVVRQYQQADLILLNGADYAKWIDKVTLPKSKLLNTSKSFKADYIPLKDTVTHSHGPSGEHAHGEVAFTTWLDPLLAIKQADSIKEAFIKMMPESKDSFIRNYESLRKDLEDLNNKILNIVSSNPKEPLLSSHPVYQYLARRYDLNLKSVHWEPDEMPGADQLKELNIILENHPAMWMIWEDEPRVEIKDLLAEMHIQSAVFNPCSNDPGTGNYMEVMNKNADNLKQVFN
ncbi:MAG: metal ABC transporter substrate-binding protein [Thermodesulfobacteriales bacterium]